MRFGELVQEWIAEPLGMDNTRIANRAAIVAHRPNDYVMQEGVGWINPPAYQWSNWQAAGGLESTIEDLHFWNRALADYTILSEESTKQMLTVPQVPGNFVALGTWSYQRPIPSTDTTLNIGERRGAIGGFAVLNAFDLQRKEWVILLSNHGNPTLDTLPYAPCLPLDLFSALHDGTTTMP
jgi:CubicO group peptidase (beta-lactamase class C family)